MFNIKFISPFLQENSNLYYHLLHMLLREKTSRMMGEQRSIKNPTY